MLWHFYILKKCSMAKYFFQYFVGTNNMLWALFWHFYILKVLFLSIFCRYFRYCVGTKLAYGMALYINASIPTKH